MPKNLVVCCDGTANKFGTVNTNVVKLCATLAREPGRQVLFYDPGVGTIGDQRLFTQLGKKLTRLLGGAIGRGVVENLSEAYAFLCAQHEPGDKIFLFGFSRGAYTVRALAGLVHMYGLVAPNSENLWPYLWGLYRKARGDSGDTGERFRVAADFKRTLGRRVAVDFVGVWDTVSSVGWFFDPMVLPYTRRNPSVATFRHAVSIDERRAFFRQNLWKQDPPTQDVKEVWFAGVHCDVGGGYPEPESGLSKLALEWMLREAEKAGLIVDPTRRQAILGGAPGQTAPDPLAEAHESLTLLWWPLEFLPRLRWIWQKQARRLRVNLGKRRSIGENPLVHESVEQRIKNGGYGPPNLPAGRQVEH